ncbi:DNA cross-link repair protein [Actinidia chinensis var. chinensis]|uniref:DNA cross-link repair protein n=1 Tax=Actinidia chinensis var. chinensis TaxID=1590841 RepID=A0A2R6RZD5_ACTCC|nr:DNA cross-link repair protein [Actinidia chinensis var. chinensis]
MEKRSREAEAEALEEGLSLSLSLSSYEYDGYFDGDGDGDGDAKDEESPPTRGVDDNGFPLSPDTPPHHHSNSGGDTNPSMEAEAVAVAVAVAEQHTSSFAADFYRCGTDGSSLLSLSPKQNPKRLKQTNLFQMWDINKHKHNPHPHSSPSSSSLHHPRPNNNLTHASSTNLPMKSNTNSTSSNRNSNKNAFLLLLGRDGGGMGSNTNTNTIRNGNKSGIANKHQPRVCPFYKKIPGTSFTVDAFRYGRIEGCSAYFLSHFHADHYGGLSKAWSHGPIYCTHLTARLVRMCLYVNPIFMHPLELGIEYVIKGIKVTMLEANHCPGAALIHFYLPNGQCYLHTGDFRASKLMHAYPLLVKQRVNVLYLDTTYCNPKYRFPSKEDVLTFVVRVTETSLRKQPKTLIIVGAYSIGKECVYLAISKALGVKIYTSTMRRRILQSFGWPELSGNLCSNGKETPLHVLPISSLKFEALERYWQPYMNQYTTVLAFRPTGWTYSEAFGSHLDLIKPSSRGIVTIYGVPYSEHSSFTELKEFVQFLRPDKIIPTVSIGNAANRDKMQSYFRQWLKG